MNPRTAVFVIAALTGLALTEPARSADGHLSPERLDVLDGLGYFTPAFKSAVHDLVDAKHNLAQAKFDQAELAKELPDLQKQAAEAEATAVALRQELAKYDHPEETDFLALQAKLGDSSATLQDQIAQTQAYIWTYPTSPHQGEAQQYLQQALKTQADLKQADEKAEAARQAAHAALVQRAVAHNLNLNEWRDFLHDMSQDDLVKLLGHPTAQTDDYWIYSGDWITDPTTHQKVGMEINFNGGRVLNVDEKPPSL